MARMSRSLKCASFYYPHLGREAPVEFGEAIGAEAVDLAQRGGRRVEQRLDVNALAARRERREVVLAPGQHIDGAVMVPFPQVMERDPDLQDALVEIPDVAGFGPPQEFERLVLLEKVAAIELRDAFEKEGRRRFVARHALILSRLIGPVFYLHGFASSAKSTKAGYFAARLQERGVALQCPDFNEPDFATLTMTRMLDQLGRALPDEEGTSATLIGSSLGGALAVLAAARWPDRVGRLVLLAPAVMIAKPGHHLLPPEKIDEWRRQGTLPFFHYAYGEERPLDYGFHLDTQRQDPVEASFTQPTLIFQGLHDRSVDHTTVEAFARSRSNVTLSLLEDDHQLIASLPVIWDGIAHWLGLAA